MGPTCNAGLIDFAYRRGLPSYGGDEVRSTRMKRTASVLSALLVLAMLPAVWACSGSDSAASTLTPQPSVVSRGSETTTTLSADSPDSTVVAGTTSAPVISTLTSVGVTPRHPIHPAMAPKAELRGDTLSVSATTDLIDGCVISWMVGRDRGGGKWDMGPSGTTEVRSGRFSFQTDVSSITGDKLYVSLSLSFMRPDSQPQEVVDKYGALGRNLEGDHVHYGGDYRWLEYWLPVSR